MHARAGAVLEALPACETRRICRVGSPSGAGASRAATASDMPAAGAENQPPSAPSHIKSAPPRFKPPSVPPGAGASRATAAADKTLVAVFSVLYCKRGPQKHKKRQDGVLTVDAAGKLTLYDTTAKTVGMERSSKSMPTVGDEDLSVGAHEVTIEASLGIEDYTTPAAVSSPPAAQSAPRRRHRV